MSEETVHEGPRRGEGENSMPTTSASRASSVVRPPTIQDAQGIRALLAELGYTVERHVVERALNDRDHCLLVAEADGYVIGFINAHFRFHLHHSGVVCTIDELIVSQESQRRGIGRDLIEAVIARARSAGAKAVDVSCHLRRAEAHAFYEGCGFERTSYKFIRFL